LSTTIALLRSRSAAFSMRCRTPGRDPLHQKQLGELARTAYIAKSAGARRGKRGRLPRPPHRKPTGTGPAKLTAEAQLRVAKVKVHLDDSATEPRPGCWSSAGQRRQSDNATGPALAPTPHHHAAQPGGLQGARDRQNLLGTAHPVPANAYF